MTVAWVSGSTDSSQTRPEASEGLTYICDLAHRKDALCRNLALKRVFQALQ